MNADAASLGHLHDVMIPEPVPWWPPAPGWYWLGGFVFFLFAVAAFRWVSRWQANCYRREALRELARQVSELQEWDRRASATVAMALLLKRAALTAFPREEVASLSGTAWLAFLDRTGQTRDFTEGPGYWLEKVAYDPWCVASMGEEDAGRLAIMVRHWLAHHRGESKRGGPVRC